MVRCEDIPCRLACKCMVKPPNQGWPNRDPIAEKGFETVRHIVSIRSRTFMPPIMGLQGPNLYEFVAIVCRKATAGIIGCCLGIAAGCAADATAWNTPRPFTPPPWPSAPPGNGCSVCQVNSPPKTCQTIDWCIFEMGRS